MKKKDELFMVPGNKGNLICLTMSDRPPQTKKQLDRIAALNRRDFVQLLMKQKDDAGESLITKAHAQKAAHIPGIASLVNHYESQIKNLNCLNSRSLWQRFKDFISQF